MYFFWRFSSVFFESPPRFLLLFTIFVLTVFLFVFFIMLGLLIVFCLVLATSTFSCAVFSCGSHLCGLPAYGSRLWFSVRGFLCVVFTCGSRSRSSLAAFSHCSQLWSSICGSFDRGSYLLSSSFVVLACGFLLVVLDRGSRLRFFASGSRSWFSPAVCTSGSHLWFSLVFLACGSRLWSSFVVLACGFHLCVILVCSFRSSSVVFTHGSRLHVHRLLLLLISPSPLLVTARLALTFVTVVLTLVHIVPALTFAIDLTLLLLSVPSLLPSLTCPRPSSHYTHPLDLVVLACSYPYPHPHPSSYCPYPCFWPTP